MSSLKPVTPHSDDLSAIDPGILAFGTSVTVNDDLRRSILSEVAEIEKNTAIILEQVKAEEKIHDEQSKSRAQTIKESRSILEGVTENAEALEMNQHILQGLESTFYNEIIGSCCVSNISASEEDILDRPNLESPRDVCASNQPYRWSLSDLHTEHNEMVQELQSIRKIIVEKGGAIRDLELAKTRAGDFVQEVQGRIEEEKLHDRVRKLNEQVQAAKEEHNEQQERHDKLLEKCEDNRRRLMEVEEEERKLAAELQTKKELFQEAQVKAETKRSEEEEEQRQVQAVIETHEEQLAGMVDEREKAEKTLEKLKLSLQRRDEHKQQREAIRAERLVLQAEKTRLESTIAVKKENIENMKRNILHLDDKMVEIEKQRKENDSLLAQVLQGKSELTSLNEQKEKLLAIIDSLNNDPDIIRLAKLVDARRGELSAIQENIKVVSESITRTELEIDEKKRSLEELQKSWDGEVLAIHEAQKKCEEDCVGYVARLEKLKHEIRQATARNNRAELHRKMRILQLGAEILRKTRDNEKAIQAMEGDLDESEFKKLLITDVATFACNFSFGD